MMETSRLLVETYHRLFNAIDSAKDIVEELERLKKELDKLKGMLSGSAEDCNICQINEYASGAEYPEI